LQRIVLLVQDEDSDVRQATLEAIVAFSQYGEYMLIKSTWANPLLTRLRSGDHRHSRSGSENSHSASRSRMARTGDYGEHHNRLVEVPYACSRSSNPVSDIPLDEFRSILAETGILQRIISLIEDEDWDVRQAVLRALASLAEHGWHPTSRLLWLIDHPPAEIRMVISGQDVVHTVISLLGHDSRWVRRTSLEAMIALSEFSESLNSNFF
jgi:hypothetical protein